MKLNNPRRIAKIGGVVNVILGARIGAFLYDAYPGGRRGLVVNRGEVFFPTKAERRAQIELYEKRNGEWTRVGEVSNEVP